MSDTQVSALLGGMNGAAALAPAAVGLGGSHVAERLPPTAERPEPARRIGFVTGLIMYPLMPKRYGPHLAVMAGWRAGLAFLCGLLLVAVTWFMTWFQPAWNGSSMHDEATSGWRIGSLHEMREALAARILNAAVESSNSFGIGRSTEELLAAAVIVGGLLIGLPLLAVLLMPFAAGGDSTGSVFKRSLKNVYWSTTLLAVATSVWIVLAWSASDDRRFFMKEGSEWVMLIVMLSASAVPVVLWLRAVLVGAGRYVGPEDGPAFHPREPACDRCGYRITGLGLDRRCPECGLEVRASLPGGQRSPTVWEQHQFSARGFRELLRLQRVILAGGADFFRRLPVHSGHTAARHFWWGTYLLMAAALLLLTRVLASVGNLMHERRATHEAVVFMAILVMLAPLLLQALMLFAACVWAQWQLGFRDYRVAATVGYYNSPALWGMTIFLMLAVVISSPVVTDAFELRDEIQWLGTTWVQQDLMLLVDLGLLLLGGLFWTLRVRQALRAVRYANV